MTEEDIIQDLTDTFNDSFDELFKMIEETDLSNDTIENLQGILEKDMRICKKYILKDIKEKRWY